MRRQLVVVAQVAGLQAGEAMCMDNLTAILAAGKSDFFFHLVKLVSDRTPILIIEHFASVQRSRKEIVEKKKVMRNEHRLFHFACVNDVAAVESPVASSPGQMLPLTTGQAPLVD